MGLPMMIIIIAFMLMIKMIIFLDAIAIASTELVFWGKYQRAKVHIHTHCVYHTDTNFNFAAKSFRHHKYFFWLYLYFILAEISVRK